MIFKVGDLVRRTGVGGPLMRLGSVWEVVGVEISDNGYHRIKVPRLGWYAAEGFALDEAAPDPVVLLKATPHKWAKEIKAWADGAEIEYTFLLRAPDEWSEWRATPSPSWETATTIQYRIKPEKKPDVVGYMRAKCPPDRPLAHYEANDLGLMSWATRNKTMDDNIQCTFDGETGKLKAVQLLSN